jgi:hypothetical protein
VYRMSWPSPPTLTSITKAASQRLVAAAAAPSRAQSVVVGWEAEARESKSVRRIPSLPRTPKHVEEAHHLQPKINKWKLSEIGACCKRRCSDQWTAARIVELRKPSFSVGSWVSELAHRCMRMRRLTAGVGIVPGPSSDVPRSLHRGEAAASVL